MATLLHPMRPDNGRAALGANPQPQSYSRNLPITDFDIKDNHYPTLVRPPIDNKRMSAAVFGPTLSIREQPSHSATSLNRIRPGPPTSGLPDDWQVEELGETAPVGGQSTVAIDLTDPSLGNHFIHQSQQASTASLNLPPGARAARINDPYTSENDSQRKLHIPTSPDPKTPIEKPNNGTNSDQVRQSPTMEPPSPTLDPPAPVSTGTVTPSNAGANMKPIASPTSPPKQSSGLPIPVSQRPRVYAQQPRYVNPPTAPNPISPRVSGNAPEEVCLECTMRDQDMADVDVCSPGVWERQSDAAYEELVRREMEEQMVGVGSFDANRPKSKGGKLTEQNLKVWCMMNPREPASRQQTLDSYIKAQRALLEAEALARARAMQESRQLGNQMRDAYSQLRRSAYEMGVTVTPIDDNGAKRIRSSVHSRSQSRDVTLLENGLIVEHVDVKREEREERERKRKESKRERSRARKSSRGSAVDVTSLYSVQSVAPMAESGLIKQPSTRHSQANTGRPISVLTTPSMDRAPSIRQPYSSANYSDAQSIRQPYSSATYSDAQSLRSPSVRTNLFSFRNLSQSWRSQDSLAVSGMTGSMIDMHLALDGANTQQMRSLDGVHALTGRRSQVWPVDNSTYGRKTDSKSEKKKGGLAKIWRFITSNKSEVTLSSRSMKNEDDTPLAPPPPLSYLVGRQQGDMNHGSPRHSSTPSLPSTSPRNAVFSPALSNGTSPSSMIPSPSSSRPPGDVLVGSPDQADADDATRGTLSRTVHSVTSETDLRQAGAPGITSAASLNLRPHLPSSPRPQSVVREKSLPPLPPDIEPNAYLTVPNQNLRSQPNSASDSRDVGLGVQSPPSTLLPPQADYRDGDASRKSFIGEPIRPEFVNQVNGGEEQRVAGQRYDEFGDSRYVGPLRTVQDQPFPAVQTSPTRRRSKFGFPNLLSKKRTPSQPKTTFSPQDYYTVRSYDGDDMASNGYTTSASKHSATSIGTPKMSLTTRKNIEERVTQDREFIAYRYPSGDQGLEVQR